MILSTDQEQARATIRRELAAGARELVLSGPAGSGKTTLMRSILDDLDADGREVVLVAPTGKAAARLRDLAGRETSTIHRPLYRAVAELADGSLAFTGAQAVAGKGAVVVCDEASMVGRELYADLVGKLPAGAQLLCVGDREQLPPVGDTWGAAFERPTALLTQVHRQAADSPIVRLATAIREGRDWRTVEPAAGYMRADGNLASVAGWLALRRACGDDATLLAYSNATRRALNRETRRARGHESELEPGDVLVCTRTAHGLGICNGETRSIVAVRPTTIDRETVNPLRRFALEREPWLKASEVEFAEGESALVLGEYLADGVPQTLTRALATEVARDQRGRVLVAEYGEALTVHKAQGSQWDVVGLVHDATLAWLERKDPDAYRRLLYTATTRAAKQLVIFEV